MSRPGAIKKALYYPMNLDLVEPIAKHLKFSRKPERGAVLLDPTCGKGEFVKALGDKLASMTGHEWIVQGIEIEGTRAAAAKELLGDDMVVHAAIEQVQLVDPNLKAKIVFLNPPYDNVGGERVEPRFVRLAAGLLAAYGLMIIVVPESLVGDGPYVEQMVKGLRDAKFNGSVSVYRTPEPYYSEWKQCVIFAGKGSGRYSYIRTSGLKVKGTLGDFDAYRDWADEFVRLEINWSDKFMKAAMTKRFATMPAESHFTTPEGISRLYPYIGEPGVISHGDFRPLTPMMDTHASLVAAAGMLNGLRIGDVAVRAAFSKCVSRYKENTTDGQGNNIMKDIDKEDPLITLSLMDLKTGDVTTVNNLDDRAKFEEVMLDNAPLFVGATHREFPPLCSDDVLEKWRAKIEMVHAPRKLKGRKENGLFEAQKLRVAQLLEGFQHRHAQIMVGEMSVGKTVMSLAAMAAIAMRRRPANRNIIVYIPPREDLLDKWAEEAKRALREFSPEVFKIRKRADLDEAFSRTGENLRVLLIKDTTAKQSSGWERIPLVRKYQYEMLRLMSYDDLEKEAGYRSKDVTEYIKMLEADDRLVLPVKDKPDYYKLFKKETHWHCPGCGGDLTPLDTDEWHNLSMMQKCPFCGGAFWQNKARDKSKEAQYVTGQGSWERIEKIANPNGDPFGKTPLHERLVKDDDGDRRLDPPTPPRAQHPFAFYIRERHSSRYVLIVDESHKAKGGDTNIGHAFYNMVSASYRTLQMTGTIFGGKASSIFYLLFRTVPEFREIFDHRDEKKFVDQYGLRAQETIWTPQYTHDGFAGYKQYTKGWDEIPGMAPGMAALLLPSSVFMRLEDLGHAMQPYSEHTLFVDAEPVASPVNSFLDQAKSMAVRCKRDGDGSPLSQWMYAKYGTWDILFEPDEVKGVPTIGRKSVVKGDQMAPKEEALLRLIWTEKQAGRKVVVFVGQINRRNPTARWKYLMSLYGMKGITMWQKEKKRIAFMKAAVKENDAVFCSPELIEVGVDLEMFQTAVWIQPHFNMYVVPQANRRLWRLTQTMAVKIIYMGYNETAQAHGLMQTAEKMAAQQAIQGDLRSGLANLLATENFVSELQEAVAEKERYDSDMTVDDLLPLVLGGKVIEEKEAEPEPKKVLVAPTPKLAAVTAKKAVEVYSKRGAVAGSQARMF